MIKTIALRVKSIEKEILMIIIIITLVIMAAIATLIIMKIYNHRINIQSRIHKKYSNKGNSFLLAMGKHAIFYLNAHVTKRRC